MVDWPMTVLPEKCRTHKSRVTREVVDRLVINMIWNLPNRPDLNGIEFLISIAKLRFKQLKRMKSTLAKTFEESMDQVMSELTIE